ncbi:MAG TPA: ATP-dependent zinc metalloprotease FtsH [Solirubrobacterales bacterium]|nr:ATP-dependent zinc metalloprotease FtsH [Solirubrobacterales bacterium]
MRRFFKSAAFPILLVVILAFVAQKVISSPDTSKAPSYNELVASKANGGLIANGKIEKVTINTKDNSLDVTEKGPNGESGESFSTGYPPNTEQSLLNLIDENNVETTVHGTGGSSLLSLLTYILPFVLFFGFWIFLMNQMQGGGSRVMNFGKSKAKRMSVDAPKITFRDVAGVDEAVQELQEIKEFLENPKKFQALGARIPKGVLLYGPPGTGKTLLARAVAGEAGVPFFSISGSDFVEMFVGVGASRVRDLFEQAKQNSPCIIFMDEIDAVGRHRGAGMGGGHDEREQTLNQLLVEMDGFEMKDNIILIAATNRPDILDPALLRPGRFDRQVVVDRPDRKGRKHILEVHTRGKPLAKVIDLDALAGQTPGFTGADLANLINEAALLTARTGKREITMQELEEGIMRVIAGPEKKTRVMSEKERLITAFHEMGHAIVGHLLENTDPVHKISIISRGQALGYTISLPGEDKFLTSRAELTDTMAMTLGGRAAEEIVFGEITTGASNDLEKVTETAKQMVMRFGMSERLGPRVFGHDRGQPFLGREFSSEPDYSDEIAREIDDEIRRIVESAHQTAKDLLTENRENLDTISKILLKRETIDAEQFIALLDGKSEDEVFVDDEEPTPPVEPAREPERAQREGPVAQPRPRPGFAGGDAS